MAAITTKHTMTTFTTHSKVMPRSEPVIVERITKSKSAKRRSITTLNWADMCQSSPKVTVKSKPVANGKLETLPVDFSYCERVIERIQTRQPLMQRVLNRKVVKGDVVARGATHGKMTLISLEDAQRKREVIYHSVEHLDNGAAFGRGFRTDLISLRDARQRAEIKYRTVI